MSITETKDFKHSIHCIDCAYEDLGYNGTKECLPRTRSCKPVFPYDLAMKSRIRKSDLRHPTGASGDGASGRAKRQVGNLKISREG